MNNNEFFEALSLMEKEKGIKAEYLAEKVATAIVTSVRRDYGGQEVVFCDIDCAARTFNVYVRKTVVDEVMDEDTEIMLPSAQKINKNVLVGDTVDIQLDTAKFGRIAAQTAKHVIRQGIREAEKDRTIEEFQDRNQEVVAAIVRRVDERSGNVTLEIGRNEAILPKSEQIPDEGFYEGQHIRVFVVDVKDSEKGAKIMISRSHPGFIKRLFETEVPEIFSGEVEIKSVSREAGSRTKLAAWSNNPDIEPVGACIGQRGARVNKIVEELHGEKIDVIKYSETPEEYISAALAPAQVLEVLVDESGAKSCMVMVPDSQLSLAIGNKGQNVRLAAKLTGWKIDIHAGSGYFSRAETEEVPDDGDSDNSI